MEFRGGVTTSLGMGEGLLYERVFENMWDLKDTAYYMSFLFCCNRSSQTWWLKIAQIYYLMVLSSEVENQSH